MRSVHDMGGLERPHEIQLAVLHSKKRGTAGSVATQGDDLMAVIKQCAQNRAAYETRRTRQ